MMSGPARLAYHAVPRILCPVQSAPPQCFHMSTEGSVGALGQGDTCRQGPEDGRERLCSCGKAGVVWVREKDSSVAEGGSVEEDCSVCCPRSHQRSAACTRSPEDGQQRHEVNNQKNSQGDKPLSHHSASPKSPHRHSCQGMGDTSSDLSDTKHSCRETGDTSSDLSDTKHSCWETGDTSSDLSDTKHSCREMGDTSSDLSDTKHSCQEGGNTSSDLSADTKEMLPDKSDKPETQGSPDATVTKEVNKEITGTMLHLDWGPFAAYLSSSRLNVNIRQVLKPGQTFQQTEGVQSKRLRSEKES